MTDKQIFQILGLVYLSVGLGMLLNGQYYKQMLEDFKARASAMYIGGICALLVGFLLVTFHNIWTMNASIIITIIGWMALLKGVLILIQPNLMIKMMDSFINLKTGSMKIMSGIVILLGVILACLGFLVC